MSLLMARHTVKKMVEKRKRVLHRQSLIDNNQSDPDLLLHDGGAIDPALLPLHSRHPDHTQPNVDLNNQNEAGMRE